MTTLTTPHLAPHAEPAREIARRSTAAIILTAAGLGIAAFLTLGVIKDKPVDPVIPTFNTDSSVNYQNLNQLQTKLGQLNVPVVPKLAPAGTN